MDLGQQVYTLDPKMRKELLKKGQNRSLKFLFGHLLAENDFPDG